MADQTESTIAISAAPDAVMAVIADFPAYPDWNDEVKLVEVLSLYEDSQRPAQVRFVLDAGAIKDDYVLEYEWVGEGELRWHLVRAEMLKAMDGAYVLTASPEGTDVAYRLAVDLRIPMIGMIRRKAEKVIIERALNGLKHRVEG
jgi:Polyketide cyclase / dehydrase and lipid transport